MYASKNGPLNSALDGFGMGLGFTFALLCMALIREVFGSAKFFGIAIPFLESYKIEFLTGAPGGFFVFGVIIAIINAITRGRGVKKKDFSCDGCPAGCGGECCDSKKEEA